MHKSTKYDLVEYKKLQYIIFLLEAFSLLGQLRLLSVPLLIKYPIILKLQFTKLQFSI